MKWAIKILSYCMPLLCSLTVQSCTAQPDSSLPEQKNADSFILFELFTSEGCSSCPPAEKIMNELNAEQQRDVFILTFHVDYWDHLGWKDPFSNAAYSLRQRNYASHGPGNDVYTPQLIVNGNDKFVGSDKEHLAKALHTEKVMNSSIIHSVVIKNSEAGDLNVSCGVTQSHKVILNAALVQKQAVEKINAGENKGRQLPHTNIVRDFKSIIPLKDINNISLHIPDGLQPENFTILLFVQDKTTDHVLDVYSKPVNGK